jgi:bacterioferritin (cytochrome b1)
MLEVHRLLNKFNAKRIAEQQEEESIGVMAKKCKSKNLSIKLPSCPTFQTKNSIESGSIFTNRIGSDLL